MSDLLGGLETILGFPSDISTHLRIHVTRIDEFLTRNTDQAHIYNTTPSPSLSQPPLADERALSSTGVPPTAGCTISLPHDYCLQLQTDLTEGWLSEALGVDTLTEFGSGGLMGTGVGGETAVSENFAWLLGPSSPHATNIW